MSKKGLVESFSGIRGVYGEDFTDDVARRYAQAFSEPYKGSVLVIGGDSRKSNPALRKIIIESFRKMGVGRIIDVGIIPVQACEYSILKFKASGGVYISASHNEPEYNGLKFLKEDGGLLYPEDADSLIKKANSGEMLEPARHATATEIIDRHEEAVKEYANYILESIGEDFIEKIRGANFKILADPNGGSAVVILDKIFKLLNVNGKILNNELGRFGRLIEPNVESLKYLQKQIDEEKFDFGCGFDCDADRVEIVAPSHSEFAKKMGPVVSGNYVLALCCDSYLEGKKNQTVVTNDCTSYLVRDVVKKHGAAIKETEVGEMNVVSGMEKWNSAIGGEGSCGGVIVFPVKCRDGIISIVLILKMLAEREKSLTDILDYYPEYYSERTKLFCSDPVGVKNRLEGYFKNKGFEIIKTGGEEGGLKILFDRNSYLWFRQSKTEAGMFRIISDGNSPERVAKILKKGISLFNKINKE